MKPWFSVFVIALLATASCLAAPSAEVHSFTAKVGDVRLSGQLVRQGKKMDDKVTVTVRASLLNTPLVIADVRTAAPTGMEDIDFLVRYLKANITGTAQEMGGFWLPTERAAKSAMFSDSRMMEANRTYLSRQPGLTVLGLPGEGLAPDAPPGSEVASE